MSAGDWIKDNAVALTALMISVGVTMLADVYRQGINDHRLQMVETTLERRSVHIDEFEEYKSLLDSNVYYSKRHNSNIKKLKEDVSELKSDQKVTNVILVDLKNVVKDLSIVTGELKNILGSKITRIEEKVDNLERER